MLMMIIKSATHAQQTHLFCPCYLSEKHNLLYMFACLRASIYGGKGQDNPFRAVWLLSRR